MHHPCRKGMRTQAGPKGFGGRIGARRSSGPAGREPRAGCSRRERVHRRSAGRWIAMRPGDAVFQGQEGLPTWVVTLIRELGRGGKEASPHLLTPLAALAEEITRHTA